jgi:hypothetical protein
MAEQLKYPLALASKLPSIGATLKKKRKWRLLTKSTRSYRLLWGSTMGLLEGEVNRALANKKGVEFVGSPFHDIGWYQAITFDGE